MEGSLGGFPREGLPLSLFIELLIVPYACYSLLEVLFAVKVEI